MKKSFLTIALCLSLSILGCHAQNKDMRNIEQTIKAFSKAGDENNADELSTCLDDNYRIIMNRLFGSEEVSIMPKSIYLEKIKSKEFGGDSRVLTIENTLINGSTASAKVTFKGTKTTFVSLIILIKDKNDNWKLISDVPIVL